MHGMGVPLISPVVCAIVVATTTICHSASLPPGGPGIGVHWGDAEEPERKLLTRLLEAPHWPFRAVALLRLERFDGSEVDALTLARLTDEAWSVRAFALRAGGLRGLDIPADALNDETDPRVFRAALRIGAPVPNERLARAVRLLLPIHRSR